MASCMETCDHCLSIVLSTNVLQHCSEAALFVTPSYTNMFVASPHFTYKHVLVFVTSLHVDLPFPPGAAVLCKVRCIWFLQHGPVQPNDVRGAAILEDPGRLHRVDRRLRYTAGQEVLPLPPDCGQI